MLFTQQNNLTQNPNTLIYLMYGGLIIFFIHKIYKSLLASKQLKGQVYKFSKNPSKLMFVLALLIISFGAFNIYMKEYISGSLMIILVLVLYFEYSSSNLFAENGFIAESKFIEWGEVKKWAFNAEKGELVVKYKKGFEEKTGYIRLEPKAIREVDEMFRKFKLKK